MPRSLTGRQRAIFDFIRTASHDGRRAPSYREIAAHFSITVGGLQAQLRALEAKGVLVRDRTARSLRVSSGPGTARQIQIPLLGRVQAGVPTEAIENLEDHVGIEPAMMNGAEYALRAEGDSMEPDIVEGDILLVRRATDAQSGATVVAFVGDDKATVKRLRKANRRVWLEAANPKYPPIRSESLQVIGWVVGLVRSLR